MMKASHKWILAYRLRYKKTLKEPNRLVVWDVRRGIEYERDSFELEGCKIVMKYGNSIKQEKQCGAKLILEVYIQDI